MIVDKYIFYFNQRNFTQVAKLFASSAILAPAFEQPIVGRKAICRYLECSVWGIYEPMFIESRQFSKGRTQIDVSGYFQTASKRVKLDWTFLLNTSQEIALAQIKLRVRLCELKQLRLHQESVFRLQRYSPTYGKGESCLKVTVDHLPLETCCLQID